MTLIDWAGVLRGALWISGLSVALAAWAYTWWWAGFHQVRLRRALGRPLFQIPFFAGLALFCIGLAWGADRPWARIVWVALALGCLAEIFIAWRLAGTGGRPVGGESDETHQ